jgi:putative membrane protein
VSTAENTHVADRRFYAFGAALTLVILGFLAWLLYLHEPTPGGDIDVSFLPAVNAGFNSLASLCLVSGFIAIRSGKRTVHKYLMISALAASTLFLISYVIYHSIHGDTKYPGDGALRTIYLVVLASHVLLSMILPFLALTVLWFVFRGQFARHKRIARITLPIWLYVSVTGVIIFAMLKAAAG